MKEIFDNTKGKNRDDLDLSRMEMPKREERDGGRGNKVEGTKRR